ncbi:MAG: diguanylate cyclase [Betaproteobacteria bacterium]
MRNKIKVIILSILAALSLWSGDAAIDAFVFRQGAFTDLLLFGMSSYEFFFRSLIVSGLVISGVIINGIVLKRNLVAEALRESNETLCTIADAANDAIVMMDNRGKISFWNPSAEKIFGYAADEAVGREMHALLAPQRYHGPFKEVFSRFQDTGESPAIGRMIELTAKRKDGAEFLIEVSLSALKLNGKGYTVGILRDITQRRRAEEELRAHRERLEHMVAERTEELHASNELLLKDIVDRVRTEEELCRSENLLTAIFDSFHEPFSIVDREYTIVKFNQAYIRIRDKRATELFGKKCYTVLHNRNSVCEDCLVEKTFRSKDPCAKEKPLPLSDGSMAWVEIYTYPIFDYCQSVSHVIVHVRDITERKKEEEEKRQLIDNLNYLSTTDSLTGILNRRALNDMLNHEIERAIRYNADLSLILCDIDKFKNINDTFGHTAGDRALLAVTEALKESLRKSDILGRYGGDEFMIILPETTLAGAHCLAEKIRTAVEEINLELPGNNLIKLSLSVGLTKCGRQVDSIDSVVGLADTALYASKQTGRNKVSVLTR